MRKFVVPVVFLAGLVCGGFSALTVTHAMNARNAWPQSTMRLIAHHHGELKRALASKVCDARVLAQTRVLLPALAREVAPAMPEMSKDFAFQKASAELIRLSDAAASSTNCETLLHNTRDLGDVCQRCHQKFR